jgi:hypothetical protein
MTTAAPIPDDRPLTTNEASLVRWLLEHGTPAAGGFLPQLAVARVAFRCTCGCASIDFAIGGVIPAAGPIGLLADYEYQSGDGHLFGAFVFERAGLLAGLEVWSIDGRSAASWLPEVDQLKPIGH